MNVPYIKKLMDERTPKYKAAADNIIVTDGPAPWQVAEKVDDMLTFVFGEVKCINCRNYEF